MESWREEDEGVRELMSVADEGRGVAGKWMYLGGYLGEYRFRFGEGKLWISSVA